VVVPCDLGHVVAKSTAHHHPHQKLGSLRTCIFHKLLPRDFGQNFRIADDVFETILIKLFVNEARTLTILLRRQTASPQNHDLSVLWET